MSQVLDLSGYLPDAEPIVARFGDKTYTADIDCTAGFYEEVLAWCNGLRAADETEADKASIVLVARAYSIDEQEAAALRPRMRRDMLTFFVTGPYSPPEETKS